jgi:glycosyltransferase involved in cell wall biosynthesis
MNKMALLIAYYFPPLGMGGVQRMAKLAKYLPHCGYDVKILTVKPIRYPAHDKSLLEELPAEVSIHRSGSSYPARIGKLIPIPFEAGRRVKTIAKEKTVHFWPDSKIGWKRPALKLAARIIGESDISVILSSSPPITSHLVAMDLKNRFGLPWVADFRDPWESRPPEEVYRQASMVEKSQLLLREIVDTADAVTAINDSIAQQLSLSASAIMGGYDPDDFNTVSDIPRDDNFVMCYMGTVGPLHPLEPFLEAGKISLGMDPDLKKSLRFRVIGANDRAELNTMAAKYGMERRLDIVDYLPHREAIMRAASAAVTLISVPGRYPGILTGKIFDYLPLPAPVLASVPVGGEIDHLIKSTRSGVCVEPGKPRALAEAILQLFRNHQSALPWEKGDASGYSRMEVARHFASVFNRISLG